jgi:hypothetical protein
MTSDTSDNVVGLDKRRAVKKALDEVLGKYPALAAGYQPIEDLVDWYLANGYTHGDMLHAFVYPAAAQCFRDDAGRAKAQVVDVFVAVLSDLLSYGPHYGHEAYGGRTGNEQQKLDEILAEMHTAIERYRELYRDGAMPLL